jgi:hypothetical protein
MIGCGQALWSILLLCMSFLHAANNKTLTTEQLLALAQDAQDRLTRTADPSCIATKRLVFTPSGTIGDRLLATASAALLAIASDRVLELNWQTTKDCPLTYERVFSPSRERNLMKAFLWGYTEAALLPNVVTRQESACELDLTRKDGLHSIFLMDRELFLSLAQCQVLFVRANEDFSHIITDGPLDLFSGLADEFSYSAITRVLNVAFRPAERFLSQARSFLATHFRTTKWLSIVARNVYVNEAAVQRLTECANALLDRGEVHKVFFTTDSNSLRGISLALRNKKDSFVDSQLESGDFNAPIHVGSFSGLNSSGTNSAMEMALLDWFVLGEAQYCLMAYSDTSSFTKSSILRGRCELFPIDTDHSSGSECSLPARPLDKESFFDVSETRVPLFEPSRVDSAVRARAVSSLLHQSVEIDEQCFERYVYQTENPIHEYWKDYRK